MTSFEGPIGPSPCRAVVAIPANNEAERIGRCLAALALQRDRHGAPLRKGLFEVLVLANNCTDATVAVAKAAAADSPQAIKVIVETLPADQSNAGGARKRAMDLAVDRLMEVGRRDGVILTTDADSLVSPTWVDATLEALSKGVDAVAGYVDADPAEMMRLGRPFIERGRLEERYMALVSEINALCDPRAHDPWPTHRVSAGASLAVTLQAYQAIGGLPERSVGEDMALSLALEDAGFKIRHALDVSVSTSMRFDGRVAHGAAETMRHRHENANAPCDEDFEPALEAVRRAIYKGRLRRMSETGAWDGSLWAARFRLSASEASALLSNPPIGFESFWHGLCATSPLLRRSRVLRPSDLPREIKRADACLRALRFHS